jgi:hypothetical protein
MRGEGGRILYVGQSKDLRTRLAFYKNANPDRIPRRLTRLVHQVETILLERCPTAIAARTRELELLRLHQPKFNRADTGPRFHHYIDWRIAGDIATIHLHLDPPTHPGEEASWRGPIRGRLLPCQALASLQRLAHCATHQLRLCNELPLLPTRLTSITISNAHVVPALAGFLSGASVDLVTTLLESQSAEAELPLRQLHECDAGTLLSWARVLADV